MSVPPGVPGGWRATSARNCDSGLGRSTIRLNKQRNEQQRSNEQRNATDRSGPWPSPFRHFRATLCNGKGRNAVARRPDASYHCAVVKHGVAAVVVSEDSEHSGFGGGARGDAARGGGRGRLPELCANRRLCGPGRRAYGEQLRGMPGCVRSNLFEWHFLLERVSVRRSLR